MPKTRQQKQEIMSELSGNIKGAKSVVFANFQGLKMKEIDELRNKCKAEKIQFMATKKTLLKKALTDAGFQIDTKPFNGGVSVVTGPDEVTPAKIVYEFQKTHKIVDVFGGILEGNTIDTAKVAELSKLPTKQQLLGQLVNVMNGPVSGFVNVLAGNLRGLVNVLNAVKDKKPAA